MGRRWAGLIVVCAVGCATPKAAQPTRIESRDAAAAPVASTTAPVVVDAGDAAAHADEEAKIVLVDAGAEPRRVLRYAYGKRVETARVDMKIGRSQSELSQAGPLAMLPTIRSLVTYTPVSVDADGTLTQRRKITHVEVLKDVTVPPNALDELSKGAAKLEGVETTSALTARGMAKSTTPEDDGSWALRDMSAPLPEEAVGVGAKWELRSATRDAGGLTYVTEAYVAREMSANQVVVDIEIQAHSPPRSIPPPRNAPAGVEIHLDSAEQRGKGTMTFWLDRMAPMTSLTTTTTTILTVRSGGGEQKVQTTESMTVTSKPLTK